MEILFNDKSLSEIFSQRGKPVKLENLVKNQFYLNVDHFISQIEMIFEASGEIESRDNFVLYSTLKQVFNDAGGSDSEYTSVATKEDDGFYELTEEQQQFVEAWDFANHKFK